MDTTKTITHIGLCAGYGGIELGLSRAIPNLRSVALCEIEAFPIANLVAKMEAGLMDAAPIWTDLKTFPWSEFRGRVDILTGGYPCQPFSAAGKRAGSDDPRHLWPFIADGIRLMRPKMCFFENVEGHITLGLSSVISDLEELGYKATWGIFSAREVGAPHQRKRVFILAYDTSIGIQGCGADWIEEPRSHAGQGLPLRGGDAVCAWEGCELANTFCNGSGEGWLIRQGADGAESVSNGESWGAWPSRPGQPQHGWEPPRVVGNAASLRSHRGGEDGNWEQPEMFGARLENMGNAEGSRPQALTSNRIRNAESDAQSTSAYADRRQAQPALGRDADGSSGGLGYAELYVSCDNRTDELRLLGNGVVPAVAEQAFRTLLTELLQ